MNDTETKFTGKLDITVPEDEFEAGQLGTISIIIKNPFDVPIEITDITIPRSSHLKEPTTEEKNEKIKQSFLSNFFNFFRSNVKIEKIRFSSIHLSFEETTQDILINAGKDSKIDFNREIDCYKKVVINAEEGAEITIQPPETSKVEEEKQAQIVAPHCDTVIYISIATRNWLVFKPTVLRLNPQCKYRTQGIEKTQVISTSISVKPPITSVVIGALVGAILGTLARLFQTPISGEWWESLITIGGACVMSSITVIALSRKSGTQGFITVEDFYGGFATGALIGYGGSEYFEQAINSNQDIQTTLNNS